MFVGIISYAMSPFYNNLINRLWFCRWVLTKDHRAFSQRGSSGLVGGVVSGLAEDRGREFGTPSRPGMLPKEMFERRRGRHSSPPISSSCKNSHFCKIHPHFQMFDPKRFRFSPQRMSPKKCISLCHLIFAKWFTFKVEFISQLFKIVDSKSPIEIHF